MTHSLLAAATLAVAFAAATDASAFNIGLYRLGMSNKEAARVGLTACTHERESIVCTGDLVSAKANSNEAPTFDSFVEAPEVRFDSRSGVLVSAQTHVPNWRPDDQRRASLMAFLNIQPCPPKNLDDEGPLLETCYVLPNRARFIYYTPGGRFLTIRIEISNKASVRHHQKKAEEGKRRELERFQSGK